MKEFYLFFPHPRVLSGVDTTDLPTVPWVVLDSMEFRVFLRWAPIGTRDPSLREGTFRAELISCFQAGSFRAPTFFMIFELIQSLPSLGS